MRTIPLCLILSFLVVFLSSAQSIQITSTCVADTIGMPAEVIPTLDHRIDISVSTSALGGNTDFRIGLGSEQGDESALNRAFSTTETGTFDDGCSLESSGGSLNICLGTFSGMGDFHVTVTPVLSDGSDGTKTYGSYTY